MFFFEEKQDVVEKPLPANSDALTSQNYRMAFVGRDFKDHPVPTPLPWTGLPTARSGCSYKDQAVSMQWPVVRAVFLCLPQFAPLSSLGHGGACASGSGVTA